MNRMMRKFWPLLMAGSIGSMPVLAASADTVQLLVGSYTAGKSEGIYRLQFDSRTGKLDSKPLQVIKTANPSWLALSPDQRRLYAVNENGPGQKDPVGRVSGYSIDPKSHQLKPINKVQSLGNEPTHASLSADQRYLFVANYSVLEDPGGSLAVLPVDAKGKLATGAAQQPSGQPGQPGASGIGPRAFGGVVAGWAFRLRQRPGRGQGVRLQIRSQGQPGNAADPGQPGLRPVATG